MHVEAEHFAEQAVDVLRGVGIGAAVAERRIEHAVRPKAEPPGLVVLRGRLVDGDHELRARRIGDVGIAGDLIAADLGVARRIDQVDVEKAVLRVVGIEGEAQEAALAGGVDLHRQIEERCRLDLEDAGLLARDVDDLDEPGLLDHEDAGRIVGGGGDEQRLAQARRDPRRGDAARVCSRAVGVEPIDQVGAAGSRQGLPAVAADNQVGRHVRPRSCGRLRSAGF